MRPWVSLLPPRSRFVQVPGSFAVPNGGRSLAWRVYELLMKNTNTNTEFLTVANEGQEKVRLTKGAGTASATLLETKPLEERQEILPAASSSRYHRGGSLQPDSSRVWEDVRSGPDGTRNCTSGRGHGQGVSVQPPSRRV